MRVDRPGYIAEKQHGLSAMKFLSIFYFQFGVLYVGGSASSLLPSIGDNARMRDEIIENYFNLGLTPSEIALFLVSVNGIGISVRHLKRILQRLGCARRQHQSDLVEADLRLFLLRVHVVYVSQQCSLTHMA